MSQIDGSDTTTYVYNFEDNLISSQNSNDVMTYGYDPDGIRIQATVNGSASNYLVDKNRDFTQVLEERDDNGSLIVSYTYGDDLIRQVRGGTTSYYLYDGLGSVRALTDASGNATDTYTYEAFGNLPDSTGITTNNYLFTGEQLDPNIGLYYLRARYYHPLTGRFITTDTFYGIPSDPITLHKYLYANADPVNNIDLSGNLSGSIIGSQVAIGIGSVLSLLRQPQVLKIIAIVAATLLIAGALTTPAGILKTSPATLNSPIGQAITNRARARLIARVRMQRQKCDKEPVAVFFYGDQARIVGIASMGLLGASNEGPDDLGYDLPSGAFASDIPPWSLSETQKKLQRAFYGDRFGRYVDVSWFVAMCRCSRKCKTASGALDCFEPLPLPPPNRNQFIKAKDKAKKGDFVPVEVLTSGPNLMNFE